MALIGNYSVFNKTCGRLRAGSALAGASAAFTYGNFHKNGAFVNFAMQELDDVNYQVGFPWGYGGHGWKLPISVGALHGHDDWQHIEISGSGYGVAARFGIGASTLTINADGTGSMVVPAVGGATLTITGAGDIVATLLGEGSATIEITAELATGARGWLVGQLTISLDAEGVPMAYGWMEGTTEEAGLSPVGIANAVWSAVAAENNEAGTMGQKLNAAGTAGDPWTADLDSYTEDQAGGILRENATQSAEETWAYERP